MNSFLDFQLLLQKNHFWMISETLPMIFGDFRWLDHHFMTTLKFDIFSGHGERKSCNGRLKIEAWSVYRWWFWISFHLTWSDRGLPNGKIQECKTVRSLRKTSPNPRPGSASHFNQQRPQSSPKKEKHHLKISQVKFGWIRRIPQVLIPCISVNAVKRSTLIPMKKNV